ncbi:MAG: orotate phosphoribosyltransferase [Coriobacteriales bacterium]|jgi:orotate phosphoribosyltransferase|nr:orotate phosphoribosyltransferase [Coriobacteriales bacterium]
MTDQLSTPQTAQTTASGKLTTASGKPETVPSKMETAPNPQKEVTCEHENLTDEQILSAFEDSGALCQGHFRLTSGLHSDTYIQCARVLEHPRLTQDLALEAASRLPHSLLPVDLVAAPAVGGILFGFALAAALDCDLIFSERVEGVMALRRSFAIPQGARVLVAEDVVTTGGSVHELIALVNAAKAQAVAVVSLVDRGKKPDFGSPYFPLITLKTPSWRPEDCHLCKSGEKITIPGSRDLAKSEKNP